MQKATAPRYQPSLFYARQVSRHRFGDLSLPLVVGVSLLCNVDSRRTARRLTRLRGVDA